MGPEKHVSWRASTRSQWGWSELHDGAPTEAARAVVKQEPAADEGPAAWQCREAQWHEYSVQKMSGNSTLSPILTRHHCLAQIRCRDRTHRLNHRRPPTGANALRKPPGRTTTNRQCIRAAKAAEWTRTATITLAYAPQCRLGTLRNRHRRLVTAQPPPGAGYVQQGLSHGAHVLLPAQAMHHNRERGIRNACSGRRCSPRRSYLRQARPAQPKPQARKPRLAAPSGICCPPVTTYEPRRGLISHLADFRLELWNIRSLGCLTG
jgi:hypothetical protein